MLFFLQTLVAHNFFTVFFTNIPLHDISIIMPVERRCAIVPGSDFFSPEEAQLILRHRKSLRSLAVSCSDRGPSQATRRPAKPSHKDDQTGPTWRPRSVEKSENRHQSLGYVHHCPGGSYLAPTLSTNSPLLPSAFHLPSRGQLDHSHSEDPSRIRSDNKRKHATEWQDSPRRHPAEVLEDTPHVSELDSDDGITPMEVNFPGNHGPRIIYAKVRFYIHNHRVRVSRILIWVHSPNHS